MGDLWQLITENMEPKYVFRALIVCGFPLCVAAMVVMIEELQKKDLRKNVDDTKKDQ